MAHVELIDQSLRDGQQSLWGMRMRAGMILPVAREIDQAGYRVVDLTGSSIFEVLVRFCRENPWEGLDLISAAMPSTTLRAGSRSNGIVGMGLTPESMLDLWVMTLAKHGIGSLWVFDCLFNIEKMRRLCKTARDAGMETAPQLMYSQSPVHTDEYFTDKVRRMATFEGVGTIVLGDEAGVLTNDRAQTFLPAMVAAAGDVPLEAHFHNTTGLSSLNYLTAVQHGVRILHTAMGPLANGPSMPSVEMTLDNLRRSGHTVDLDDSVLGGVAEHFRHIAEQEGYALGAPREYNVFAYHHQLPGGMTGTLKNQLAQYGMADQFDAVLDEVSRVRAEMGYPVMATPFSQLVGIQAMLNVVNGERYGVVPDENLMYLAGHLGPHPGEVDPEVLDRALSSPRGREFVDWEPPQPSLAEIRHDLGESLSDEELLLRFLMPGDDVDAMYAAGPVRRDYELQATASPAVALVTDLLQRATSAYLRVERPDFSVSLRRRAACPPP